MSVSIASAPKNFAIVLGLLLAACGTDDGTLSGEVKVDAGASADDGGAEMCSPDRAVFSVIYDEILSGAACSNAGCHASASPQGMLALDAGPAATFASLVGAASVHAPGKDMFPTRVVSGEPAESFLYVKLVEESPPGARMPIGAVLDACDLEAIRDWIAAGAENN